MSRLTDSDRAFLALVATLVAICFLSKVGGSGADLAIMTGLIGICGMLAQSLKATRPNVTPSGPAGTPDDPMVVEGAGPKAEPVPITRESAR